MSQMYARVFVKILLSSLADDWYARHVFEDFLKLANSEGVVDVTRSAFCRMTNAPEDVVNRAIALLESPDPKSRDSSNDGRRIARLDEHRDWGWVILNWEKYESIRTKADELEVDRRRKRAQRARHPLSTPLSNSETTTTTTTGAPLHVQDMSRTSVQPTATAALKDVCVSDRPIEPPRGFPSSEAEARESAALCSVPEDFAAKCWNLAASRGFLDARGQQIRSWRHYAASCWAFERDRVSRQQAARSGASNGKQSPQTHRDGRPRSIAMETLREVEAKMRAMGDLP